MKITSANVKIRFYAVCPYCNNKNDFLHPDLEGAYTNYIDYPNDIKGEKFVCSYCCKEFEVDSINFI